MQVKSQNKTPLGDRLLIVDGSNLLFQMFFGMPSRIINSQGKAIQGTLGFVGALLKIIRMQAPTHVVVLFDGEHENARAELDIAYKANRTDYSLIEESETPFSQIDDVYAALDFLRIKHAETVDCETDDWVAGYVKKYTPQCETVIASWDSDFFQLVSQHVSVLRYRGKSSVLCTPQYIREKFGILPLQYADFKSLTGDTADNIKGAHKIGPKTAARLLCEFGSLENLIANADKLRESSVKNSILSDVERVQRNYKIIKLEGAAQLPFQLDELQYVLGNITTLDVLKGIGLK